MKKLACLLMVLCLLPFCAAHAETKYSANIWGTFDTVVTLIAFMPDEASFQKAQEYVESEMTRLHRIFDQYNTYDGVRNLCYVNAHAAEGPTPAEPEIMELLQEVGEWRSLYSGRTNPAMGAVLKLWHNAREDGTYLPDPEELKAASLHCGWENLTLEGDTVFFADPEMSLDLGAVAKGWSAGKVADGLRVMGCTSFILNAGGNVVCGEAPMDGRAQWTVGVEDLDGVHLKTKIGLKNASIVTSGDYQRYYELGGVRYHHLIDPDTLMPGAYMHSVSVVCEDSGMGDFLSTALFLMPVEEGKALVESIPGVEAFWIRLDESTVCTDGFAERIALVN